MTHSCTSSASSLTKSDGAFRCLLCPSWGTGYVNHGISIAKVQCTLPRISGSVMIRRQGNQTKGSASFRGGNQGWDHAAHTRTLRFSRQVLGDSHKPTWKTARCLPYSNRLTASRVPGINSPPPGESKAALVSLTLTHSGRLGRGKGHPNGRYRSCSQVLVHHRARILSQSARFQAHAKSHLDRLPRPSYFTGFPAFDRTPSRVEMRL